MPSPRLRPKDRQQRRDAEAELAAGIDRDAYTSKLARVFAWTAQTLAADGKREPALDYLRMAHEAQERYEK